MNVANQNRLSTPAIPNYALNKLQSTVVEPLRVFGKFVVVSSSKQNTSIEILCICEPLGNLLKDRGALFYAGPSKLNLGGKEL